MTRTNRLSPPYLGASSSWVVKRQGEWQLDNGRREARLLVYLSGHAPETTADCKPNEVSVPPLSSTTRWRSKGIAELGDRPLGAVIAYVPAKPGTSPASS